MGTDAELERALRTVYIKHMIGLVTLFASRTAIIAAALKYLLTRQNRR